MVDNLQHKSAAWRAISASNAALLKISMALMLCLTFMGVGNPMNAQAEDAPMRFDSPSADHPLPEIMSGYLYRDPTTQALQDDDFENPGMLWYERGEGLWTQVDGAANKSCADCHQDAAVSMKGVGASYPKWNDALEKPVTLEQQVNLCRENNMKADAWKWESDQMLSTVIFVKRQSKGMPVTVQVDGPMEPHFENGKSVYYRRTGQLNMSCANCHEDHYGDNIRSDHLSQGQSNGFPTYRLKNQGVLSLHKRFEGCIRDTRAEFPKRGDPDLVDLELYLAWRGQGLPVETPSVRH